MKLRLLTLALLVPLAACQQEAPAPAADVPPPPPMAPIAEPVPAAPAVAMVPRAFLCRGNEPFWSLDITAESALLKTPDAETELDGRLLASDGGSYRFTGAPEGSPAEAVATLITPGQCFDTMADGPALPFIAQASFAGGEPVNGCCSAEMGLDLDAAPVFDAAGKPDTDWSRRLDDLDEAIGRCVQDAGVVTVAVTTAWPMNHGKAGVRLRDPGDARFDCTVDLGSGKIDDVAAVAADDRQPGEGEPLWLPAGNGPPILDCGRVERVMLGGDAVVGYLHYTEGCD
ncbi:MAG TPA: hypothetical protein VFQ84_02825 [Arenimonas sp.]|uniref:hypothetical protein n=1 Tax=Arenimonas sp. TaxID=1872635 RepID=UPI002D7EB50C|nr:hypothetical protein [Arenimonas sp.]HEU0152262.1 hypothetical protein [Arenimonas sp.]